MSAEVSTSARQPTGIGRLQYLATPAALRAAAMTAVEAARLDGEEAFAIAGAPLALEQGRHRSTEDTGLAVWDGALILSKFLELEVTRDSLAGAAVLDLGAGCGVTSIAAAALGARVRATDLPYSLPLLQRNADSNAELLAAAGGSVSVGALDWLAASSARMVECPGGGQPAQLADVDLDLVLVADCVWDEALVEPLLPTVEGALRRRQQTIPIPAADDSSSEGGNRRSTRPAAAGSSSSSTSAPASSSSHSSWSSPWASSSSCCCCCCQLLPAQERTAAAAELASEMGLDEFDLAADGPSSSSSVATAGGGGGGGGGGGRGVVCTERDWLAGQRERGVAVCLLAYTFRLDSVDAALQHGLGLSSRQHLGEDEDEQPEQKEPEPEQQQQKLEPGTELVAPGDVGAGEGDRGNQGRRFCVSEVPAHRVPWQSMGRGRSVGRDCSDESSPPVRIFRVQLACRCGSSGGD